MKHSPTHRPNMAKKNSPFLRVRLADVAREANMSIATISMSLSNHPNVNESTRRRVQEICNKLGYTRKAKQREETSTQRKLQFGYVLLGNRLDDEAKMTLVHALTVHAGSIGVRFEMTAIEKDLDSSATASQIAAFASQLDGLILTGQVEPSVMSQLTKLGSPTILIGHLSDEKERALPANCELIAYDCTAMGQAATQFLLARGHRRIGFVSELIPPGMVHDRWLAGYQVACLRAGIVPDPGWLHVAGERLVGGKPAADAMVQLKSPPTAYVIPDVRIASSFITTMRAHGVNLDVNDVVIGGEREIALRYRMETSPMLALDVDFLAAVSLHRLKHRCEHPHEYRYGINVPFVTYNM